MVPLEVWKKGESPKKKIKIKKKERRESCFDVTGCPGGDVEQVDDCEERS